MAFLEVVKAIKYLEHDIKGVCLNMSSVLEIPWPLFVHYAGQVRGGIKLMTER